MSYSDLYLEPRYKPSKIMVGIAVAVVASLGIFFFTSESAPTRASKRTVKKQEVVNVTSRQAGVFWESESPDEGWIIYGESESKTSLIALDQQDISGSKQKRTHHYALLKNLSSDKDYFYKIISNNEIIAQGDGKAFVLHTGPENGSSGSLNPAYGKVMLANGGSAGNIFVYMTIPGAYPVIAITGNTGEWLIPLQYFVDSMKNSYIVVNENTTATIKIFNDSQTSNIKAALGKTHPIPQTTVLGENYSFIEATNVLSAQTQKNTSSLTDNTKNVSILFPKNRSVIPGKAPLIKGEGIPGKSVTVKINSKPAFTATVKVDKYGDWDIPLTRTFNPGKYILTMFTENAQNKRVDFERSYTLIKSGEQVLAASDQATPSATIIPSPTSSITSPTPTPTQDMENPDGTPTPPPPVSGIDNIFPYAATGVGLIMVGVGFILLL